MVSTKRLKNITTERLKTYAIDPFSVFDSEKDAKELRSKCAYELNQRGVCTALLHLPSLKWTS